jgi:CPA2 family monovalent cation:H+ antiporter-2
MEDGSTALAAIAIFAAVALAAFIPAAFRKLLLPAVVLEIGFGAAIGPQGFGLAAVGPFLDLLSELGLALLFLIAGFEVDPRAVRGAPMRLALRGWFASLALAAVLCGAAGWAVGLPAPGYVALAVSTTAIGALMPILKDNGLLEPPYGPFVLAAGTTGEALPLIALSLLLAGAAGFGVQSLILAAFALIAAGALRLAGRLNTERMSALLGRTMQGSGQLPVRIALLLLILFVFLGEGLGLDLVLGAFVAGAVARTLVSPALHHELMSRLSTIGYGFLIPIFFVTSGMELDLAALTGAPAALAAIPVFALLMLVVRGAPALVIYRDHLPRAQRLALAFHTGTQLPLVVAITAIAAQQGLMPQWCASALVAAAIVTVIVFPVLAGVILKRGAPEAAAPTGALSAPEGRGCTAPPAK